MPTNRRGYMKMYYRRNRKKWNCPREIGKRVERNKARRMMRKKFGSLGRKDVDHIKPLRRGGRTIMSNLRLVTRRINRAWRR